MLIRFTDCPRKLGVLTAEFTERVSHCLVHDLTVTIIIRLLILLMKPIDRRVNDFFVRHIDNIERNGYNFSSSIFLCRLGSRVPGGFFL